MINKAIFFILALLSFRVESTPIVNGENAKEGGFPYIVSLREDGDHTCGGAIISTRLVLTAAHCFWDTDPSKVTVVSGTTSRTQADPARTYHVQEISDYNQWSKEKPGSHDILIIKLKETITTSEKVKIISLPKAAPVDNTKAVLAGWGDSDNNGTEPQILQKLEYNILPRKECEDNHAPEAGFNPPYEMCVYSHETKGACSGDSGGPLAQNNVLIGIAANVNEDCASGAVDNFGNVYEYLDFINEHLKKEKA